MELIKSIASAMHLLLCKKQHAGSINGVVSRDNGLCFFYMESQLEDRWIMQDSKEWLEKAINLSQLSQLEDAELLKVIEKIVDIASQVTKLTGQYPQLESFISLIISELFETTTKSRLKALEP